MSGTAVGGEAEPALGDDVDGRRNGEQHPRHEGLGPRPVGQTVHRQRHGESDGNRRGRRSRRLQGECGEQAVDGIDRRAGPQAARAERHSAPRSGDRQPERHHLGARQRQGERRGEVGHHHHCMPDQGLDEDECRAGQHAGGDQRLSVRRRRHRVGSVVGHDCQNRCSRIQMAMACARVRAPSLAHARCSYEATVLLVIPNMAMMSLVRDPWA